MIRTTLSRRRLLTVGKLLILLGLIADIVFDKNGYDPDGFMGIVRIVARTIAIVAVALWIYVGLRQRRHESRSGSRYTDSEGP